MNTDTQTVSTVDAATAHALLEADSFGEGVTAGQAIDRANRAGRKAGGELQDMRLFGVTGKAARSLSAVERIKLVKERAAKLSA